MPNFKAYCLDRRQIMMVSLGFISTRPPDRKDLPRITFNKLNLTDAKDMLRTHEKTDSPVC